MLFWSFRPAFGLQIACWYCLSFSLFCLLFFDVLFSFSPNLSLSPTHSLCFIVDKFSFSFPFIPTHSQFKRLFARFCAFPSIFSGVLAVHSHLFPFILSFFSVFVVDDCCFACFSCFSFIPNIVPA